MSALFTTFGIDWHLLIAQVVNFGILVVALTWLLYKPVLKMVREREHVVSKGVADAEESARRLASADDEAAARAMKADREAERVMAAAREAAKVEKERLVREAEMRAAALERDAAARAHEEIARQKRESETEIARLALLAAEKILANNHEGR